MTSHPPPHSFSTDRRAQRLAAALQLEATFRSARNAAELAFAAVNEMQRVVAYDTAALFWAGRPRPGLVAVSAVAEIDRNAPFAHALERLGADLCGQNASSLALEAFAGPAPDVSPAGPVAVKAVPVAAWPEGMPRHALYLPLRRGSRGLGGLILFRQSPWTETERNAAEHMAEALAHAAALFRRRERSWQDLASLRTGVAVALVLALLAALPVRQSVLAPAEIVPKEAAIVAAPASGVVTGILVAPNAEVAVGQPLFRLDDTELRGKYEVALRQLEVARAELLGAQQKAFGADRNADRNRTEAAVLERRIDLRQAEAATYRELLARTQVLAPRAGIAVMGDPEEWSGRPVKLGERVMTIASPSRSRLQIWVPVDDAIDLEPGASVRLFLNIDPLRPVKARLVQTSYDAEMSPLNVLSYRVRAEFAGEGAGRESGGATAPRLGLKGTAKLYGESVSLAYFVFRRPLAVIRRTLGL
ncbi:efflux RND transporter periplasmic adaptor subunit [Methylorubrum populi]